MLINRKILLVGTALMLMCSGQFALAQSGVITGADTTRRVITTAVPFLTISPDARSGGMGDVGAAISPDANSVHWNPAKLAFIESDIGFSLSYTPWLSKIINDMSLSYLSGYYKLTREQAVAVSLRYFDLGEIFFKGDQNEELGNFNPRELAIDATYSRMLTEQMGVGVVLRYIYSNLTGQFSAGNSLDAKPGNSVAVDLSYYYNGDLVVFGKNSNLAFGAVVSNIGRKITYSNEDNRDFIPTNLRLGTALTSELDPFNKLTFAFDFNKLLVPTPQPGSADQSLLSGIFGSFGDAPDGFSEEMREIMLSFGLEYWYNDAFAVRTGYFNESSDKGNRKYFTMGVGFKYNVFGLDAAYLVPQQQEHPLAETLRITLGFNFNQKSKKDESVTD